MDDQPTDGSDVPELNPDISFPGPPDMPEPEDTTGDVFPASGEPSTGGELPAPDEDPENAPKPLEHLDEGEERALRDNKAYWDSRELAYAGRLSDTFEFLPGRRVTLHTLDTGEQILLGKIMDNEFGKINPMTGEASSSYDVGLRTITLSLALDKLDGEYLYSPLTDKEDVFNDSLSVHEREQALRKKSDLVRQKLQQWYPEVMQLVFRSYRDLLERKEAAMELLPFYSETGQKLEISASSVS